MRFPRIMDNHEKSMFVKSIKEALGDSKASLDMLWIDPESFGMITDDFWKL